MNNKLRNILTGVEQGEISSDRAYEELKSLPYEDLGFAKIDHHRALRNGIPEVIFCQGKTVQQVVEIARTLAKNGRNILATRATEKMFEEISKEIPNTKYHPVARIIVINYEPVTIARGKVLVVTAGTADLPVAEEAAVTATILGHQVEKLYDVGVAGIHRLLDNHQCFLQAQVIIVAAGMEGALASVVGGLVSKPIIAVPTSVGYGASFFGLAALLGMLNSCATGIGVVNIDNGFGAATLAHSIILAGEPE